jgi:hypothetical protein
LSFGAKMKAFRKPKIITFASPKFFQIIQKLRRIRDLGIIFETCNAQVAKLVDALL